MVRIARHRTSALGWCVDSGGVVGDGLRRRVSPRDLDKGGEGPSVVDSQLSQHSSVDLHFGNLETLNETVVGHAVGAGAGVDPLDPQPTKVALASAPVAVGVTE